MKVIKQINLLSILRSFLAVIFALVGFALGTQSIPPDSQIPFPTYLRLLIGFIFATFGLFLPEIATFLFRLGVARLAAHITQEILTQFGRTVTRSLRREKKEMRIRTSNPLIVDTSSIIDGRLLEIARTGFIMGTLIITPSVIGELRRLADSGDSLKRAKGRRGLDILDDLKRLKDIRVRILPTDPKGGDVDAKIVNLAGRVGGKILTTDFNLSKVAKVHSIPSLNVNELTNALKINFLPGEELQIQVVHPGKEHGQGVGYLPDGTMVVVEDGGTLVGKKVGVRVSKVLQTVAGRMVFVKRDRDS